MEILEANAARDAARETAASATPPVRTSTPVRRPEQESSTTAEPLAENTTSGGEVDFDSEDDAALLEVSNSTVRQKTFLIRWEKVHLQYL